MKIQGSLNAPVDIVDARPKGGSPEEAVKPKAREAAKAVSLSPPPPSDYRKELERLAEAIRKYIRENRTSVDITVDAELRQIVTRVIDEDSGKVIRQYPEDAALAVMKHLKELRGLLLNREV